MKQRIEIRGIDTPGKERWGSKKGESELQRSQKIIDRLEIEQRNYPGAAIKIEFCNGEFFLCVKTKEDQAMERRFAESRAIYERQIIDPRTKLRKFFL